MSLRKIISSSKTDSASTSTFFAIMLNKVNAENALKKKQKPELILQYLGQLKLKVYELIDKIRAIDKFEKQVEVLGSLYSEIIYIEKLCANKEVVRFTEHQIDEKIRKCMVDIIAVTRAAHGVVMQLKHHHDELCHTEYQLALEADPQLKAEASSESDKPNMERGMGDRPEILAARKYKKKLILQKDILEKIKESKPDITIKAEELQRKLDELKQEHDDLERKGANVHDDLAVQLSIVNRMKEQAADGNIDDHIDSALLELQGKIEVLNRLLEMFYEQNQQHVLENSIFDQINFFIEINKNFNSLLNILTVKEVLDKKYAEGKIILSILSSLAKGLKTTRVPSGFTTLEVSIMHIKKTIENYKKLNKSTEHYHDDEKAQGERSHRGDEVCVSLFHKFKQIETMLSEWMKTVLTTDYLGLESEGPLFDEAGRQGKIEKIACLLKDDVTLKALTTIQGKIGHGQIKATVLPTTGTSLRDRFQHGLKKLDLHGFRASAEEKKKQEEVKLTVKALKSQSEILDAEMPPPKSRTSSNATPPRTPPSQAMTPGSYILSLFAPPTPPSGSCSDESQDSDQENDSIRRLLRTDSKLISVG